jgi:YVTN family beta-propeller protein
MPGPYIELNPSGAWDVWRLDRLPDPLGAALRLARPSYPLVLVLVLLVGLAVVPGADARTLYVAGAFGKAFRVNTTTNKVEGGPIPIESEPREAAITPDGTRVYLTHGATGKVSMINATTGKAEGSPISVGGSPDGIAITPNGRFAYVVNRESDDVSVINLATNAVEAVPDGNAIEVGKNPGAIAISPDGTRAFVVNAGDPFTLPPPPSSSPLGVSVINLATNDVEGGEIPLPPNHLPNAIAIAPDGSRGYIVAGGIGTETEVAIINTATNQLEPNRIVLEHVAGPIAITPDGSRAYVAEVAQGRVSVINLATEKVEPNPIKVGATPEALAITADGARVYVANLRSNNLSVIDTATNQPAPEAIPLGEAPLALAITPNQPPLAAFTAARARPGVPLTLDASTSKDSDSRIATYGWSFGDGQSQTLSSPIAVHTFASPGIYRVSLREADTDGCSTPETFRFTGQTASCNGSTLASTTQAVKVAYPGVRVRCPKSAKPRACGFKLRAVAGKPRPKHGAKALSAVAKVKVKAGKSAIVSLRPKKAFRGRLAGAKKVLVKETRTIGASKTTRLRRLRIVQ